MNQRIRQLAEQAYDDLVNETGNIVVFDEDFQQRFAQLIVKECAKFLDENSGYDNSNNAWHPEPDDLLKHFGVEE